MEQLHDFQFMLPIQNDDLLNSRGDQYYVQQVYEPSEIPQQLLVCKQKAYKRDPFYLFEHFDTYFSVIEANDEDKSTVRNITRSFDLLYMTVDALGEKLAPLLATTEPPTSQNRGRYLNLTKMTLYLQVNTVKRIEFLVQKSLREQQINQQKKRGKQADISEEFPDWNIKRGKFLVQLFNILQCPLEKLWNPPVVEENFVTMLCDVCYRILESQPSRAENRHILDTIFQIIGTAIKRYNHAIVFPVRILQILRSSEHAAAAVANGIVLLNDEYGLSTVFSILIKDILDALTLDSTDMAVSRNFSNFLTEFSSTAPKLIIPHLSKLGDELLGCESHVLRNCVLQIMGDAVLGELTSEELDEDMKEARNEFLDSILTHINDISAHVRAKVLHIWHQLKENHGIPLTYVLKVLREAVCRLDDKSSLVRKAAMQLIKAFLVSNPYSGKLSLKELMQKHEKEVEKLDLLSEVLVEERRLAEKLVEEWEELMPLLLPIVEEHLRLYPNMEFDDTEKYEEVVEKIVKQLLDKNYKEAVVLVRKAEFLGGNQELSESLNPEGRCLYHMELLKTFLTLASGYKDSTEEMDKQIKTVEFLKDSIDFSSVITNTIPKLLDLLLSTQNTDVYEAVDLFTTGYEFSIRGTELGMQRMLCLVWLDQEKRDAVSNAYRRVLFTTNQTGRAHAIKVVQNLCKCLSEIEQGHYIAIEALISEWVSSEDIDAQIILVLFERFTLKLEGTTANEARLALQLLIMISLAKPGLVTTNRTLIENIATGERGKRDPRIFSNCLRLLINGVDTVTNPKYYPRLSSDAKFVQEITNMFLGFFFHPLQPNFDELAMSFFEFYFKICQAPDVLATQLIMELLKRISTDWLMANNNDNVEVDASTMAPTQTANIPHSQQSMLPVPTQPPEGVGMTQNARLPVYLLARFIFCIGYMTIKEMVFLDIDIYSNMKHREELTKEAEKQKNIRQKDLLNKVQRRQTANISAMEVCKRLSSVAAEPQQEPDEDLVGASAEDTIAEEINAICEDMLLFDPNALISKIYPLIIEICKRPGLYRDQNLQQAASLALARLMTVSSKFCESNMSFLMNILSVTKNIKIKCNNVIGLSDLTFRFPNIIEPWTGHFYSQLHEENTDLRLTAVKMLSHLILHEMIRVKGQIAVLALCIVDEHDEIRNITKQFFKEISNKSNILYNVLPDIISKLSDTNLHLEEEKYHTIMRYILSLIQKDRQIETLVEKLCLRFLVTHEERQWRDIAYCLSLLSYNERSVKKLIDNVKHFKDKVQVDEVYQSFKLIISNSSKLAKAELKAVINEFETRLNECLDPNAPPRDDSTKADTKSKSKSARKQLTQKGRRGTATRGGRKHGRTSSESESEFHSSSEEEAPTRKATQQRGKKNQQPTSSSESDAAPAANAKTPARNSKVTGPQKRRGRQ